MTDHPYAAVPGAGAFVRRITRQELVQLYDGREALEPVATARAAALGELAASLPTIATVS